MTVKDLWGACISMADDAEKIGKQGALAVVASLLLPEDEDLCEYIQRVCIEDEPILVTSP